MGWKETITIGLRGVFRSQSAFAGYGLEAKPKNARRFDAQSRNPLSLDMGWKTQYIHLGKVEQRRNPLSLDMGWKWGYFGMGGKALNVAIRFRWIWVGSRAG